MGMRGSWVTVVLAGLLSGCSGQRPVAAPIAGLPAGTKQVLVVQRDGVEPVMVRVFGYELDEGGWRRALGAVPGVIGRKGFAAPGEKREGDGKTPTGIYPLLLAFSSEKQIDTYMPVRVCTADSYWVDDPLSPDYNHWVYGKPRARSFERMLRDD